MSDTSDREIKDLLQLSPIKTMEKAIDYAPVNMTGFTKLTSSNFSAWKWSLRNLFKDQNLYDCITVNNITDPRKESRALNILGQTLSDEIKNKVIHCTTSYSLYTEIESIFVNTSSFQATQLHMQLSGLKFKPNNIDVGLSEVLGSVAQLKNLGEPMTDRHVEGVILSALPPSFRTFITVWKGKQPSERTLTNLANSIRAEIEDNKFFENKTEKALVGREVPKRDSEAQASKRFRGDCNYCKKPGHMVRDCRKLKKKKELDAKQSGSVPKVEPTKADTSNKNKNAEAGFMAVDSNVTLQASQWLADSGASRHMTPHKQWFHSYLEFDEPINFAMGNDTTIQAYGSGDIETTAGTIHQVYYVPEVSTNLFSISSAARRGITVNYDQDGVSLYSNDKLLIRGELIDTLYVLEFEICAEYQQVFVARSEAHWHAILGHISKSSIKDIAKSGAIKDLKISSNDSQTCADCALNKQHARSHPTRTTPRSSTPGETIHFDTVGPIKITSIGGNKYFVLAKDEASGFRHVAFVSKKEFVPIKVRNILQSIKLDLGKLPTKIFSDNGTEYVNHKLSEFLEDNSILHDRSVRYTPQQNGLIERDIRTIVEAARTMLNASKLKPGLWAEAVNSAVYLLNRVPKSTNPMITPFELWYKRKPSANHLHVFGCPVVTKTPKPYIGHKFAETGKVQYFVGYTERTFTFRIYDPEDDCVRTECNLKFLDTSVIQSQSPAQGNVPELIDSNPIIYASDYSPQIEELEVDDDKSYVSAADMDHIEIQEEPEQVTGESIPTTVEESNQDREDNTNRPNIVQEETGSDSQHAPTTNKLLKRLLIDDKLPEVVGRRLRNREQVNICKVDLSEDPSNYKDAMTRPDRDLWLKAMKEEMDSMSKTQVWRLVDKPAEANLISNRWVFKSKRGPEGIRYRARFVARGFSQIPGVDYSETYSPVVNMLSVRLLLAYASLVHLNIKQFDVKTAFLYGDIEEDLFMTQPEGFEDGSKRVCKLQRSLYGLKQSPRQWNRKFSDFLTSLNLRTSDYDNCIFFRTEPKKLFIAVYVDDGLILAEDKKEIELVVSKMKQHFEIHEVECANFLGFQIKFTKGGNIMIHQETYISKMLDKFNMSRSTSVENPCAFANSSDDTRPLSTSIPYREAIGSLTWATNITRVDIAYSVNKLSRKVANPTEEDWTSIKRIFRYLTDKRDLAISYEGQSSELIGYSDSDFAGDESRKSTTGYVILFAGGPILWKTQRQTIVTLSSTEAELVSLCSLIKELIWVRSLCIELGMISTQPTQVLCDNSSTIKIINNQSSSQRTRHLGVKAAFSREQIKDNQIVVKHVSTTDQLADLLTKPMLTSKYITNRNKLMTVLSLLAALCITTSGMVFEGTKPIIWVPTRYYIDGGVVFYDILIKFKDTCEAIQSSNVVGAHLQAHRGFPVYQPYQQGARIPNPSQHLFGSVPSQPSPSHLRITRNANLVPSSPKSQLVPNPAIQSNTNLQDIMTQSLHGDCKQLYASQITQQVVELSNKKLDCDVNPRLKRGALSTGIQLATKFINFESSVRTIVITCITNLVVRWIHKLDPNSDENQLKNRINLLAAESAKHEFQLASNQKLHQHIIDSIYALKKDVLTLQVDQRYLSSVMPHVSWAATTLQLVIAEAAGHLRAIIDEASFCRVSTEDVASLFNITELHGVNKKNTRIEAIEMPTSDTLHMVFSVNTKSPDADVYLVNAFNYYENLTESPSWMTYEGGRLLMFNKTNNCIKQVSHPVDDEINDKCLIKDYVDPTLSRWRPTSIDDIYSFNNTVQVKESLHHMYVYCFPHNIIVNNNTLPCPPNVFRLHYMQPFEIPITGFTHHPVYRIRNMTSVAVDSIHMGHFQMGSEAVDLHRWYVKMRQLSQDNKELRSTSSLVVFGNNGHGHIMVISIVIHIVVTLIVVLIMRNRQTINQALGLTNTTLQGSDNPTAVELSDRSINISYSSRVTPETRVV